MRRHRYSLLPFALLALAVATPSAFAWGPDGHRIVADIAAARLSPQAAAEVKILFDKAPLEEWASWPDEIRNERPETAAWHYVDIPANEKSYDATRDGNKGANVIDAIAREEAILADRSKSKKERAEALSFVVHLIGDVEQPLHTAERDKDRGGNSRLVFLLEQPKAINLHSAWDSGILRTELGNNSDTTAAAALNAKISKGDAAEWAKGTVTDWVNESHRLAIDDAYNSVPENGPPPHLNQDYVDRALSVINIQLQRGGVRLAAELNRLLANTPATTQASVSTAATR